MSRDTIAFDRHKYASLKAAFGEAVMAGEKEFVWSEMSAPGRFASKVKDHRMLTSYARYLLEYLKPAFDQPDLPAQPYKEGEEGQ